MTRSLRRIGLVTLISSLLMFQTACGSTRDPRQSQAGGGTLESEEPSRNTPLWIALGILIIGAAAGYAASTAD